MARNQHSYAKRQLEMEKKKKADEKRAKRLERKRTQSDLDEEHAPVDGASATQDVIDAPAADSAETPVGG